MTAQILAVLYHIYHDIQGIVLAFEEFTSYKATLALRTKLKSNTGTMLCRMVQCLGWHIIWLCLVFVVHIFTY